MLNRVKKLKEKEKESEVRSHYEKEIQRIKDESTNKIVGCFLKNTKLRKQIEQYNKKLKNLRNGIKKYDRKLLDCFHRLKVY